MLVYQDPSAGPLATYECVFDSNDWVWTKFAPFVAVTSSASEGEYVDAAAHSNHAQQREKCTEAQRRILTMPSVKSGDAAHSNHAQRREKCTEA